jgi:hypothetical protein
MHGFSHLVQWAENIGFRPFNQSVQTNTVTKEMVLWNLTIIKNLLLKHFREKKISL